MRYLWLAAGLAAVSVAAQAQETVWGIFDGENGAGGAGVSAADGSQLMIKCDKTGKGQVHALLFSATRLVPPTTSFERRDVRLRFDADVPIEARWRYYNNTAMAVNQGNERSMTEFVTQLATADKVEFRLDAREAPPVTLVFDVHGASDAIALVYEKCKDTSPVALAPAP